MADFNLIGVVDGGQKVEAEFDVAAGAAASISSGQLVTMANGYAVLTADGGLSAIGYHGLAITDSTDTVGAAGKVTVVYSSNGLILRGAPTTAGNLATAIVFDRVTLDVAAGVQTVDENDAGNGIATIMGYDATSGQETIDVVVAATL